MTTTTTTTTPTTTVSALPTFELCPVGISICQNGALCLIVNGINLMCNCAPGYQGIDVNFIF